MDGFIIVGNPIAVKYACVEPLLRERKVFALLPEIACYSGGKIQRCIWYSTFDKERKKWEPTEEYAPEKYPHYDNYPAIEVVPYTRIPKDYDGLMGVGIGFYFNYPEDYEVIEKRSDLKLNGKKLFDRFIIRRKEND